jgi:hypothetical protein
MKSNEYEIIISFTSLISSFAVENTIFAPILFAIFIFFLMKAVRTEDD